MAFRVKDLMIQVVPGEGDPECSCGVATKLEPAEAACGGTLCSCTPETKWEPLAQNCGGGISLPECSCGVATAAATPPGAGNLTTITTVTTVTTVTAIAGGGRVPGLKELMEQLRRVLEESERQGVSGGPPKTVEESEDLERRLGDAIKELQAQRKSLYKAKAPAKKARKGKK